MAIPTYSERAAIADAVAAVITAAKTAGTFGAVVPTIQRVWLALEDLPNVPNAGPLVSVVPYGPETREILSRKSVEKDFGVLIGIEQRLPQATDPASPAGNAAIDAMDLFAEQVAACLEPDQATGATGVLGGPPGIAAWVGSKVVPYNYGRLHEKRIFTSAITATYKRL